MFNWTDRELNPAQSEAIMLDGSVFLVACPGSGKTRALTYKIAYELSRLESDAQYVVAITYTHRAADEIKERIEQLGVDTRNLWIGTIHAFCLEWIIRPYGIYEPELACGFQIIDMHDREKLLERLCARYKGVTFYDCDFYFKSDGYHLGCQNQTKHNSIHKVLGEYFQILAENRQVDFELILWYASRLIEQNPIISGLLSKVFSLVLVDEYQDTKQIQYGILTSIVKAGAGATRLFMVGDPNQAIFGSLGGYAISIDELREMTAIPISERKLSQNYRSSSRVVDYFGNFNVYSTEITAIGPDREYPSRITYSDDISREDLSREIARLIRHSINELGVSPSEICVVAPQWPYLTSMTRHLAASLPDIQFEGPGIVPFARDTENFWYKLSRIVLTEPSPSMYGRRLRWAGEAIRDMSDAGVSLADLSPKTLLRMCNEISPEEANGLAYLHQFFQALFEKLGVEIGDFPQLRQHYEAFFASSQSRIAKIEAEGVVTIGELDFFRKVFQNRSGVTVSTIHGVKGAEFDVVIGYALLEGMVPHFSDMDGDASARKLLYVVGSRARKNLHLFSETGRPRGRYEVYGPTRKLAGCRFDYDDP